MNKTSNIAIDFEGVFTALVTPFDEYGAIDMNAVGRLMSEQLASGIAGLVILGTTGEAATLQAEEKKNLVEYVIRENSTHLNIWVGTGSNDTTTAIAQTQAATQWGANGILLVTPYYNKPTAGGLLAHFEAVAESTNLPIMLYNVPGRTGIDLLPSTVASLAHRHANIVGIKEAGGSPMRVTALRNALGNNFVIHCGDDALAPAFYAHGAQGLTSVMSNVDPWICVAIYQAMRQANWQRVRQLHEMADRLIQALFYETSPSPVKYLLSQREICGQFLRLPMVEPLDETKKHLMKVWSSYLEARDHAELPGFGMISGLLPASKTLC